MFNELDWENIEIGDRIQYEEKYHLQLYVTIIDKEILNDETHDNFCRFKLKVDKYIGGIIEKEVGDKFWIGKSLTEGHYLTNHMKFKERGSTFEYYIGGDIN